MKHIEPEESFAQRMARWEASIPKKEAICYVCNQPFTTYEPLRTTPPDPIFVQTIQDIKPVDTCLNPYCLAMDIRRQDALFHHLSTAIVEKYFQDRADEIEKARKKRR